MIIREKCREYRSFAIHYARPRIYTYSASAREISRARVEGDAWIYRNGLLAGRRADAGSICCLQGWKKKGSTAIDFSLLVGTGGGGEAFNFPRE